MRELKNLATALFYIFAIRVTMFPNSTLSEGLGLAIFGAFILVKEFTKDKTDKQITEDKLQSLQKQVNVLNDTMASVKIAQGFRANGNINVK